MFDKLRKAATAALEIATPIAELAAKKAVASAMSAGQKASELKEVARKKIHEATSD